MSEFEGGQTPAPIGSLSIEGRNGGRLRNGGTNKGGKGQPPSVVRALAREKFRALIPKLNTIARRKKTADRDIIRAIDVLGKYGMDRAISIEDVRACLKEQSAEIYDFLPREHADALMARLKPIWKKL